MPELLKKCFYIIGYEKQGIESTLGKRKVSVGESGSFVRGKSEFPLRKVKEAELGRKRGYWGKGTAKKLLYILLNFHTESTEITERFALQKVSHRSHR